MNLCCSTSRFLKERIMSDTALKNARMSDALERSLIREAVKAETVSSPFARGSWLRLKARLAVWGGAVGEVLHDMDAGRQQHPVISARH
jgi:hypothetical protein